MTREELDALGHGIAYDAARTTIECNCLHVSEEDAGGVDWFDVGMDSVDLEAEDHVRESVTYLEMRGLIQRHEANPDWVTLIDESEATV